MATVVYYSGAVQGVGFRATAASIARRHPAVRGWVRNLPDGRVELLADGASSTIQAFLADIRSRMEGYIESEETTERAADSPRDGFHIKY
jgi:acylphosphatase